MAVLGLVRYLWLWYFLYFFVLGGGVSEAEVSLFTEEYECVSVMDNALLTLLFIRRGYDLLTISNANYSMRKYSTPLGDGFKRMIYNYICKTGYNGNVITSSVLQYWMDF